jgi:hypothetical protein
MTWRPAGRILGHSVLGGHPDAGRSIPTSARYGAPNGGMAMRSWEAHDRDGIPPDDVWRARARYVLLGTAFLTSPLLRPFALALLMTVLRGTPLGPALLQHLHLVVIGSLAYCLTALAAACIVCPPAPHEAGSRALLPGPGRVSDPRHLQFQRWLVVHGQHVDDAAPALDL